MRMMDVWERSSTREREKGWEGKVAGSCLIRDGGGERAREGEGKREGESGRGKVLYRVTS